MMASGSFILLRLHKRMVSCTTAQLKGCIIELPTKAARIASFSRVSLNRSTSIWETTEIWGARSTMSDTAFMPGA